MNPQGYARADDVMRDALSLLSPPMQIKPAESATKYLRVGGAGGYEGPWDSTMTPYMVEPMNRLADRTVEWVAFVGPAQSGKTESLLLGWMAHSIVADPCDMMIVQSAQHEARDFSKRRIDRVIRNSPELKRLMGTGQADNVFDKMFKNGAYINIGWPTISQLSGKPIRHIALTDYDRFGLNIDGEGDPFSLARNRTKSFMSRGKTLVETSPGHEVLDPDWKPSGHGAPPTHGALGLFNLGSRHRLYWPCPHCNELFRADWDNLSWDKHIDDDAAAAATAHMVCPVNACIITPNYKALMNAACVWQSEAQVFGTPYTGRGATYWMQGPAAAFETWENLVYKYLIALRDFENTGNQEKLKSTVNTDQGRPYTVATAKGDGLDAVLLKQRAEGYAQQRCVPAAARFLTTAVDVQKHRFVVQVTAWGVDKERWIVDRYNLTTSDRIGEDGTRQKIAPFTHAEDWNVLDKLLDDRYAIEGSDATVQSLKVLCDSGGGKGDHGGTATANAYVYALRLRRLGRLSRFALLKGASSRSAARYAKGKADEGKIKVPLYVVNTTILKDETAAALNRQEPGPGYIHLPDWAGEWYFKELTAEVRTSSGWAKRRKADNNEEFDLMGYQSINYSLLGGDKINWETPPDWAAKPLGEVLAEADTVQASGNEAYLKALRERGQRRNG